jgi:hypothetical protein
MYIVTDCCVCFVKSVPFGDSHEERDRYISEEDVDLGCDAM